MARLRTMTGLVDGHASAAGTSEDGTRDVRPLHPDRLSAPVVVELPRHLEWPQGD